MSDTLPLVSVIIPVYNVEDYLDECVESVTRQTYSNIEIILVDDGSTDNSPVLCDNWEGKDERIHVIHKKNGGLSDARNKGIETASGEFLFFIDSDDFISSETIMVLYEAYNSESIGVVSILPYIYPSVSKKTISSWLSHDNQVLIMDALTFRFSVLKTTVCICAWGKLIRKELLNDVRFLVGRKNEDTRFCYDLSKEMEKKKLLYVELPSMLYAYRKREGSICSSINRVSLEHDYILNLKEIRQECETEDMIRCVDTVKFDAEWRFLCNHFRYHEFDWIYSDFKNYPLFCQQTSGFSFKELLKYFIIRLAPHIWSAFVVHKKKTHDITK